MYSERSTGVDLMLTNIFLLKTLHLKLSNAVSIVLIRLLAMQKSSIEVGKAIWEKCIFECKIEVDKE